MIENKRSEGEVESESSPQSDLPSKCDLINRMHSKIQPSDAHREGEEGPTRTKDRRYNYSVQIVGGKQIHYNEDYCVQGAG
jgi:hypothetical protein